MGKLAVKNITSEVNPEIGWEFSASVIFHYSFSRTHNAIRMRARNGEKRKRNKSQTVLTAPFSEFFDICRPTRSCNGTITAIVTAEPINELVPSFR